MVDATPGYRVTRGAADDGGGLLQWAVGGWSVLSVITLGAADDGGGLLQWEVGGWSALSVVTRGGAYDGGRRFVAVGGR